MKTTVEISDPLLRAAREHCASEGMSFRELVEGGLRQAMERPLRVAWFRLKVLGFQPQGQSCMTGGLGRSAWPMAWLSFTRLTAVFRDFRRSQRGIYLREKRRSRSRLGTVRRCRGGWPG